MEELDGYVLERVPASQLATGDTIWNRHCTLPTKWEDVTVSSEPDGRLRLSAFSGEQVVDASTTFGRRAGFACDKTLIERWSRGDASQDQVDHLIAQKLLCVTDGHIFKTASGEMLLGR